MSHKNWIVVSGLCWFAIGASLLYKGLGFIAATTFLPDSFCMRWQGVFGSPQQAGIVLIGVGMGVGLMKGLFVLSKTVQRVTGRIRGLTLPIRVLQVYAKSYWLVIGAMVGLGLSLRFFSIPLDVRGFVDVAIGSALFVGSLLYFREALNGNFTTEKVDEK